MTNRVRKSGSMIMALMASSMVMKPTIIKEVLAERCMMPVSSFNEPAARITPVNPRKFSQASISPSRPFGLPY